MKRILDVKFDGEDFSKYKKKMKIAFEDDSEVETVTYKEADGGSYISDSDHEVNRENEDSMMRNLYNAVENETVHVDNVYVGNLATAVKPKEKKTKKHNTL